MTISIVMWRYPTEQVADIVLSTTRHKDLSFSTAAMGGFLDGTFALPLASDATVAYHKAFIGHHVVFFDDLGRRLYEGRVSDTELAQGDCSVKFTCYGYYSTANELLHGLIYPASGEPGWSALTPTRLVTDTISLAYSKPGAVGFWSGDTSMVQSLSFDISPQDFTLDKKMNDAIDTAVKFGNNDTIPRPMYFSIWEGRRAFFYQEPQLDNVSWRIRSSSVGEGGITTTRSRSNVWNKIQVIYDDEATGIPSFTDWAEDKDSQTLYGLREGTMNIGQSTGALAIVLRDLAIKAYAYPEQQSSVVIAGPVRNYRDIPDQPYMVRGGCVVSFVDNDPDVLQMAGQAAGKDATNMFVSRTTYTYGDNATTLELGRKNMALDLIMSRLGKGSGSIS